MVSVPGVASTVEQDKGVILSKFIYLASGDGRFIAIDLFEFVIVHDVKYSTVGRRPCCKM